MDVVTGSDPVKKIKYVPKDEKYWTEYYEKNRKNLTTHFELAGIDPIRTYKIKYGEIPKNLHELQNMISVYMMMKYQLEWDRSDIGFEDYDDSDVKKEFMALTNGYIEQAITSGELLYSIPE